MRAEKIASFIIRITTRPAGEDKALIEYRLQQAGDHLTREGGFRDLTKAGKIAPVRNVAVVTGMACACTLNRRFIAKRFKQRIVERFFEAGKTRVLDIRFQEIQLLPGYVDGVISSFAHFCITFLPGRRAQHPVLPLSPLQAVGRRPGQAGRQSAGVVIGTSSLMI